MCILFVYATLMHNVSLPTQVSVGFMASRQSPVLSNLNSSANEEQHTQQSINSSEMNELSTKADVLQQCAVCVCVCVCVCVYIRNTS